MNRTIARLLSLAALLALAACVREPYLPLQYAQPAPPPLQPYLGPPVAYAAPAIRKRVVRHRYVRRHRQPRCRCVPVQ